MRKKARKVFKKLAIRTYRYARKFKLTFYIASLMLANMLVSVKAWASGGDDFSLNTIDDSVKGHLLGDVGRLIGYLLVFVIVSMVIARKYMIALGCLLALIVMYYFPDIIDGVFKS